MAKKTTIVNFVLDESGSMGAALDATISGFNEYVDTLRGQAGKVLFTLTQFNSIKVSTVHKALGILDVPKLSRDTYKPDGTTPLYDAIAQTIRETEETVRQMKSKPSVLCVIMTDGYENTSKEFDRERIFKLIEQKTADGWTFAYIGANQDAWAVGQSLGVPKGNTLNYDQNQTHKAFHRAAAASMNYMEGGSVQSRSLFSDSDDEPHKRATKVR